MLIDPYFVTLGSEPTLVLFGLDLKDKIMNEWVPFTKTRGPLVVTNEKMQVLFEARRIDDDYVELEQHCAFALLPFHLKPSSAREFWFRNGLALIRNGNEHSIEHYARSPGPNRPSI